MQPNQALFAMQIEIRYFEILVCRPSEEMPSMPDHNLRERRRENGIPYFSSLRTGRQSTKTSLTLLDSQGTSERKSPIKKNIYLQGILNTHCGALKFRTNTIFLWSLTPHKKKSYYSSGACFLACWYLKNSLEKENLRYAKQKKKQVGKCRSEDRNVKACDIEEDEERQKADPSSSGGGDGRDTRSM